MQQLGSLAGTHGSLENIVAHSGSVVGVVGVGRTEPGSSSHSNSDPKERSK